MPGSGVRLRRIRGEPEYPVECNTLKRPPSGRRWGRRFIFLPGFDTLAINETTWPRGSMMSGFEFLAWPIAISLALVIFVFGFMLIFKKPITRLIDRTRRIGKKGLEADEAPEIGQQISGEVSPSPSPELQRVLESALLIEREESVREQLETLKIGHGPDYDPDLIRLISHFSFSLEFERTYSLIWGSQIDTLQLLNSREAAGAHIDTVHIYYEHASLDYPDAYERYTYEEWLDFLVTSKLVSLTENNVTITVQGREFLKWMINEGRNLTKSG